jgi:hypothetical protein
MTTTKKISVDYYWLWIKESKESETWVEYDLTKHRVTSSMLISVDTFKRLYGFPGCLNRPQAISLAMDVMQLLTTDVQIKKLKVNVEIVNKITMCGGKVDITITNELNNEQQ